MLSLVLAPYGQVPGAYPSEINYAYGGAGTHLCPADPGFNTRGEQAFYSDTHLGAIPTDAELATAYQYTPVATGWVNAQEGYIPGPWRPPNGWNPAGAFGPPISLNGHYLGELPQLVDPDNPAAAVVNALNAHNDRLFKVTVISATVVGISALVNAWRTLRQLQRESKRKR